MDHSHNTLVPHFAFCNRLTVDDPPTTAMFRKQPPTLLALEELQQTYTDVCNYLIQNLTYEELGDVTQALKGWKLLHTLTLYKLELFDRMKLQPEEEQILDQLKQIRDENVKHLIRVQLRADELARRHLAEGTAPPAPPHKSSPMAIPGASLVPLAPAQHTSALAPRPRKHLMRLLRAPALGTTLSLLLGQLGLLGLAPAAPGLRRKYKQALEAALAIWLRPVKTDPFADFDQHEYVETTGNNNDNANLIDVDNELTPQFDQLKPFKLAMEALRALPLPPPIPPQAPAALSPRTYVYNKPKPINVKKIMQQTSQYRRTTPASTSPAPTAQPAKRPQMKPKAQLVTLSTPATGNNSAAAAAKKNIKYNYVKPPAKKGAALAPKTPPHPPQEEDPMLPTMDDLLDLYDTDYTTPASQEKLLNLIKGIDITAGKQILNDIVVHGDEVYWEDIVGLDLAKSSLKEAVVYPFLRPDLFRGLREPTRGMLLFGPPGTGKTMLARAVATELKSTFFLINPSSLTSKYLGESEKLVRALFLLAKKLAPLIVFIDEIDSLLSLRGDGENEASRRIKNEFLVQWSELSAAAAGRDTGDGDVSRVLILGATNMPWLIDEAARRRFVRRQYIPLPEPVTRVAQITKLLQYQNHTLSEADLLELERLTEGFSGSDITALAKDLAMGPLRLLGDKLLMTPTEQIRPINIEDFRQSLQYIKPSVSQELLLEYQDWAKKFGLLGN